MFRKSVAEDENFDCAKETRSKGNSICKMKGGTVKMVVLTDLNTAVLVSAKLVIKCFGEESGAGRVSPLMHM